MIKLDLSGIKDVETKKALELLINAVNDNLFINGKWQFIDYDFPTVGSFTLPHSLGVRPQDMIILSSKAGTLTLGATTSLKFTITNTSIGKMRILLGTQKE